MSNVLYNLCKANLNIMNGWYPYPARCIAESLNMTVSQVRYQLNKLRKQGLVQVVSMIIDEEEPLPPYRGWQITKEAEKTEEYKKAWEEEREIVKKTFGVDIGEGSYE